MDLTIKKRNSSFELVKIIAIICIVFCHSIPTERIEYHYATSDPWLFGIILLRQLGSVGNAIFMVASTWFLVDSSKTNLRKVKSMIADNQVISIIALLAMCGGYQLTLKIAVYQIFPLLFSTLWYITCYVMYYCLHGFINKALRGTESKSRIAMIVLFLFNGVIFVVGGFFFTELIGFIIAHVFTWYLKKCISPWDKTRLRKTGLRILLIGLCGWLLGAAAMNIVGIKINAIGSKLQNWNRFYNPFILAIAYGAMLLASCKEYYSDKTNWISGLSLYIYMVTGNQLLRIYPDNALYDVVKNRFGTSMKICFIFVVAYTVIKLIAGCILAAMYKKTISQLINKITNKECDIISNRIKLMMK